MSLLPLKIRELIDPEHYGPESVENLTPEQIRSLVPFYRIILDHYKTLRTLATDKKVRRKREHYISLLILAELLDRISRIYVNRKQDVPNLRKQQEKYQLALRESGYMISLKPPPAWQIRKTIEEDIWEYHPLANFLRLCVVRFRKVLILLVKNYKPLLAFLEYLGPILNYLCWIAFIPRLWANLNALYRCAVPGSWMSGEEKKLGWQLRVKTHFALHWFEWANDLPWFIAGILGCFLLLGNLSVIGTWLTVALFAYDIVLAGIRAAMALVDLYVLREQYGQDILEQISDPQKAQSRKAYIRAIDQHIHYQWLHAALNIFNTTALFIAVSLTIPALMILNPAIPLITALLIFGITAGVYGLGHWLKKYAPPEDVLPEPEKAKKASGPGHWGMFNVRDSVNVDNIEMNFTRRYSMEGG